MTVVCVYARGDQGKQPSHGNGLAVRIETTAGDYKSLRIRGDSLVSIINLASQDIHIDVRTDVLFLWTAVILEA